MASQLIAVLSAVGLASAGVAATPAVNQVSTYSSDAMPSPSAVPVYRQSDDSQKRMCRKKKNRNMPVCAAYWDANGNWVGGSVGGSGIGASGAVLPALAASVGAVGLIVAIDNGSKN